MQMRRLGNTGIDIAPLVFGGNVFGWTIDKQTSFAILDAFLEAGFNAIDTADVYSIFAPGNKGGESETIIGEWMQERGVRSRVVIITKFGLEMGPGKKGLSRNYAAAACEASLRRLRTDYIDVYLSHRADPNTAIAETLEGFAALKAAGKIRHAGCSNYTAGELAAALAEAGEGKARYEVVQPHYNLVHRDEYEGALEEVCLANGLGVIPYFSLASGFLTGKYRRQADLGENARSGMAAGYVNAEGLKVLGAVDAVAARHKATPAQVALAWLAARPSVSAPIASATSVKQLNDIMGSAKLTLTPEDLGILGG